MSQLSQNINFVDPTKEGLNSDMALKYLPPGHSPVDISRGQYGRINCRSGYTEGNNMGAVENFIGTEEIKNLAEYTEGVNEYYYNVTTGFSLPSGLNKKLGSCEDIKNNAVLWFNYNSEGKHGIYRYLKEYDAVEIVAIQDASQYSITISFDLNFDIESKITHIEIIDNLLLWVDGRNHFRNLNIDRAIATLNGFTGKETYEQLSEDEFTVLKKIALQPTAEYGTDDNFEKNNLKGKMFEFMVIFKYLDGMLSSKSNISKLPLPDYDTNLDGYHHDNRNNKIDVTYFTGQTNVTKILIYVREGDDGNWGLFREIDKEKENISSVAFETVSFYNNTKLKTASDKYIQRPFDYIGDQPGCMEVVENNQIVLGDFYEGFDNTDIDVNMTYETLIESLYIFIINGTVVPQPTIDNEWVNLTLSNSQTSLLNKGDIVQFVLEELVISYNVQTNAPTATTLATELATTINDADPDIHAFTPYQRPNEITIQLDKTGGGSYDTASYLVALKPKLKTLSTGFDHVYAIGYEDEYGRLGALQYQEPEYNNTTNEWDGTGIYVKHFTEDHKNHQYIRKAKMTINHYPFSWAKHFRIYYALNANYTYKEDFLIHSIKIDDAKLKINVNKIVNKTLEVYPNSNISIHQFQKGDRIRFLTEPVNKTNPTLEPVLLTDFIDREILYFDTLTGEIHVNIFDYSSKNIDQHSIVQIYRPQKNIFNSEGEGQVFKAVGDTYNIVEANGNFYHNVSGISSGIQSQNSTQPAILYVDHGDNYMRYGMRFHGVTYTYSGTTYSINSSLIFPTESTRFSDYYESDYYGYGQINAVNGEAERKKYAMLRHGQQYIENTEINLLNVFYYDDYKLLQEKYGTINKLIYRGNTLKALQDRKVTSIYIYRNIIQGSDGNPIEVIGKTLFSQIILSKYDYGTINPESVEIHEGVIFYYDQLNDKQIADYKNGSQVISDQYMKKYFRDLNILKANENELEFYKMYAYGGINPKYNEYHLNIQIYKNVRLTGTIVFRQKLYSQWIMYSIGSKMWKSFVDQIDEEIYDNISGIPFVPEQNISAYDGFNKLESKEFIVWHMGTPYKMSDRMKFLGNTRKQKIAITSNLEHPNETKEYKSIEVRTNNDLPKIGVDDTNWEVTNIYIPESNQYPDGKQSLIPANKIESKEGVLFASIQRDMKTPNGKGQEYNLLNGREMRGEVAELTLENKSTDEVVLYEIKINGNKSYQGK